MFKQGKLSKGEVFDLANGVFEESGRLIDSVKDPVLLKKAINELLNSVRDRK